MKVPGRNSEQGLYLLIAVAAVVVIYLVAFVVRNATEVEVSFVAFSARLPLIVLMLGCVLGGLALGLGLGRLVERRRGRRQASVGTGNGPTAAS